MPIRVCMRQFSSSSLHEPRAVSPGGPAEHVHRHSRTPGHVRTVLRGSKETRAARLEYPTCRTVTTVMSRDAFSDRCDRARDPSSKIEKAVHR